MLRISKLTDYALVILSYLALKPQEVASATLIAQKLHLTLPTASKVLKILAEAQLVTSFRGTDGGYQLARDAKLITLTQVLTALEGDLAMTECCAMESVCALDSLCAIKDNWQVINRMILTALADITLHDMMRPLKERPLALRGIPIKVAEYDK